MCKELGDRIDRMARAYDSAGREGRELSFEAERTRSPSSPYRMEGHGASAESVNCLPRLLSTSSPTANLTNDWRAEEKRLKVYGGVRG
eukprot:749583-Hanusia_phi.AAC.3